MESKPILIIGATGKTGTRVAHGLKEQGASLRYGTRRAAIPFDWEDQSTWFAALDGVQSAYVTYYPDLAFPGAVDKIGALCDLAKATGLEHLVLLSGRGEHHAREAERVVEASGLDYTLVRAAWFAQNFSEGYLCDPILAGVLPMPGGNIVEPIIDIDDIADVVIAALSEEGHKGRLYEVTGPELLSFADMAAVLTKTIGRPIKHLSISFEDFHRTIAKAGDDFIADVFTGIARETLDGRNARLANGVQQALRRPPRRFSDFAAKAAATGIWSIAA